MDYLTRLCKAADQEAPLNRIVGDVYKLVAEQIKKVAHFVVSTLKQLVDNILFGLIPGIGWAKLIDYLQQCVPTFQKAKDMVDMTIAIKDDAVALIESATDPIGALRDGMQDRFDKVFEPFQNKLDKVEHGARVAADLIQLSKVDDWQNAPGGWYQTGADPRRTDA